jgi:predicted PurR-regulated permease PerM
LVLSIWVGFVDFLPLVGGLLAGVPAVGVAFLHSLTAGIVTTVVFLVYQQIENHVLYPIIISRTVRLNPLLVLLAVLFGAELGNILASTFGAICGAIFSVPGAGVLQLTALDLLEERLRRRGERAVAE